ncbi:LuxR C-terminal-related transcriptional regulator [Bradyrhizobium lablabi]|uniref:helix-turn-helix domain-containing protein n=1 Tax=Bradyrhizobium lablabi TaxID=722472 RepID=UPI001BACA1BD|nr:response regulator transcription factor [Bradyrhizobium lablabi]
MLHRFRSIRPIPLVTLAEGRPLTAREKQLLRRMALGQSDREIAIQIGGTEAQVATQRLRLLRKLNIRSAAEIMDAAGRLAPWPRQKGLVRECPK